MLLNSTIIILASVTSLVIVYLIFLRNRKRRVNQYFSLLVVSIVGWSLTILLTQFFSSELVGKISFVFASFIPAWFVLLARVFPTGSARKKRVPNLIVLLPAIIFAFISLLTNRIFQGISIQDGSIITETGTLYPFFSLYFVGYVIAVFAILISRYRKTAGLIKAQIAYFFLGTFIFAFFAILTNLVLPLFEIYSFNTIGPSFSVFMIGFIAYSITRHKLLDLRLVVLRTITYSLVVVFISAAVVGFTLFLPEVLEVSNTAKTFIAIFASIFIVLVLDPLKRGIAKITDKLFFKARIDYGKLLAELGEIINREIDLDLLLFSLSRRLEKDLKIQNVSIYLSSAAGGAFYKRIGRVNKEGKKVPDAQVKELSDDQKRDIANRLHHNNPLVNFLKKSNDIIVLEALERKIEDTQIDKDRKNLEESKKALDELDAAVVAPVTVGNSLNAVMVVGPKLSGDPFGSEDLNLFHLIGPQLASALEKSRLYEEAQQFTERLKKEVSVATEGLRNANMQLQERNRFLQALQKVTNLITRTLDFKKVTQSIVDSIATELGYMGGVLLLLGKDRHKLFPEAITQTSLTTKGLKLLPKPFNQYYGYYPEDKSLSVEAIKTGEVKISEELSDFISPAVPPVVAKAIQKLVGIKTIVGVPVHSEDEVVGVIDFFLKEEHGELKQTDLDAMKALASQTGIVYRNIELYRQIEQSNKELEVANVHLQQLDQAKSEFVSIASHQLRTPMTGIMGYLSMVVQGDFGKVPAELKKILTGLLDESQRMIRLINLFLNVSKIESGKMTLNQQKLQLDDVITKVVDMSQKVATDKKLKLVFKKPKEKLPPVFADSDKIDDVIMNLVDNAIKYTEKGSITVSAKVDKDFIQATVTDTGRGIDPEDAKKLFTKFVRGFGIAQVNPDGSGLGLYVARRITEAHNGQIWVDSKGLGKGSTFHVRIPIYREGMEQEAEHEVEDKDYSIKK